MARDGFAVHTFGFFAEEFDERRTIGDLALGFAQGLALFSSQDGAQIVLVIHHQVEPFAHDAGTFLAGPAGPFLLRLFRLGDGTGHLRTAEVGHLGDHIAAGGVHHIKGAIIAIDPFTADIGAGFQQAGIFEH